MRTVSEMKAAIEFGYQVIEEYKRNGRDVPGFVYEKHACILEELVELYEEMIEDMRKERK